MFRGVSGLGRFLPALLFAGVLAGFGARTEAAPAPSPGNAVAERVWSKLLTHCGESYFYVDSLLEGGFTPPLREFRGVRFLPPVPIRVTDAERLNGLTAHLRIAMLAHVYRTDGGAWRDGPDQPGDSAGLYLGWNGAMELDLKIFKGKWTVARPNYDESFDLETLIAAPTARYSCQTGKITPRPPTPAEAAALAEEARKKAETERLATEEKKRLAEKAEEQRRQDAELAVYKHQRDLKEAPWRFTGSPEAFHDALKANLARRAAEFGFDANAYAVEIAAIDRAVAGCMTVTPADWQKEEDRWERIIGTAASGTMRDHQARLMNCDAAVGPYGGSVSAEGKVHPLGVNRSMSTIVQEAGRRNWKAVPTGFFEITVIMKPTPEEYRRIAPLIDELPYHFNVIAARIPYPGSQLTPQMIAWAQGQ